MKTNNLLKLLDKNKKTIIITVVVVVAAIVLWKSGKKIWNYFDRNNDQYQSEDETGTNVTAGLGHSRLAKQIYTACESAGTDENAIYSALSQLRTQADWELLQRRFANVYEDTHAWYHVLSTNLSSDLVATLQSELSTSELNRCREILEDHGIEPGF